MSKRSRRTLGDTDDDKKEQAKRMKIIQFKRTTFDTIGYPEGVELTKFENIKVDDIIVEKDGLRCVYTYGIVTEKNDNEISVMSCDTNGFITANPSRNRHSKANYKGELREFYIKHKPTNVPKTKVIDHISFGDGLKDIPIVNNTDERNRQFNSEPYICDGKKSYYLVVGDIFGFVAVNDVLCMVTSTEELVNSLNNFITLKNIFEGKKGLVGQTILGAGRASDVAKNVRTFLKYHFPETKFNVSSESGYWGTIYVKYTDSVSEDKVSEITSLFEMEWDGDLMSDYHSYKDTPTSSILGGVHAVRIERSFSRDVEQKVKKIIPELAQESEISESTRSFDDIRDGLKKEFGYTPGSWKDIEFSYSRININSILYLVDIDTKKEKKVIVPLTPTEKKIKEAIGSANIIAPIGEKGEYILAKKPKRDQMRIWTVSYSQWTVEKKQREKLEAVGLKVDIRHSRFYITNYSEILDKIEEERKKLGIPKTYSKIHFYMLMHYMDQLESKNSTIKYERKWCERYTR